MANSICFSHVISFKNTIHKPEFIYHKNISKSANWARNKCCKVAANDGIKASSNKLPGMEKQPDTKPNSILCAVCEGSGSKKCVPCNGNGVNTEDHFNGQFKAGAQCWLCGGKKEVLCGNCNGAGFIGGFMSTYDQ